MVNTYNSDVIFSFRPHLLESFVRTKISTIVNYYLIQWYFFEALIVVIVGKSVFKSGRISVVKFGPIKVEKFSVENVKSMTVENLAYTSMSKLHPTNYSIIVFT